MIQCATCFKLQNHKFKFQLLTKKTAYASLGLTYVLSLRRSAEKKSLHCLRYRDCHSLVNWVGPYVVLVTKLAVNRIKTWLALRSFCLLWLWFISANLSSRLAWSSIVMSGLSLLFAIWIYWIRYRNRYVGMLFLWCWVSS